MSPRVRTLLLGLGLTLGAFLLLTRWLDARDALGLTLGIALVASTSWWPRAVVRWVGAALLGALLVFFLRGALGLAPALLLGTLAAALAWRYLPSRALRRVCFTVPSLVVLIFVTTLFMYLAPGNPFSSEKKATPQVEEQLRKIYGVPRTATEFFAIYMRNLIEKGSLGPSVKVQGRTVNEVILPALPVSMSLGLLALLIACGIGLTLGIRAGLRPNSGADHASMALAMVGISLPNFVIGSGLMIALALGLGWLPVAGWGGYHHLVLPAVTLALPYAAYIARLARTGTIEVMQQDFVRTARAKGLPEREVVLKHAFRGAILPVVSFLGPAAAGIMSGSFVVETLFGVPGMGQWFVKGATGRDYNVVLGTAILYFTIVTLFNLVVDFAYAWLDPRIREDL